jgi:PEGA domain-containing protein
MRLRSCVAFLILISIAFIAQEKTAGKARVFITDSQSWEIQGSSGGSSGAFGGQVHGGARPQTAEIVKTFGERCPDVVTNNKQDKADYIVVLDHEGGKGFLRHRNKVAVFNRVSGDSIVSHSTLSLGGSVQEACEAIRKDWATHGAEIRAASQPAVPVDPKPNTALAPDMAKDQGGARLSIASTPDGADIEVDGNFMGSTPSSIQLSLGEHLVAVMTPG